MRIDVKFTQSNERIHITMDSIDQSIDTEFRNYQEATIIRDADPYVGEYTVTPAVHAQTLHTAQKYMTSDLTVKEIPYFETSNASHGETVYIGSEVELYGNQ